MTAPRITSTKSFKYATATVLFFGLAFIGHAMVSFLDIVKMTPVSVVVTPQASLPNEVKTLEATTVGQAFDRDTTTSYTAYGTDQISVQFESVELLHRFKVFGPAPYKVSIAVDNGNGTTTPISGWQNLSLAFLAANAWTEFDLSTDVNAQALVVTLTPQTGGSTTGIQEMEFWGTGSVWNMNGASWVSAFQGSSAQGLQLGGREYDAKPDQITVGTVSGQTSTTNSFTLNVNHVGNDFKRAWLVYEINGLPSWIAPLRAVNGEADMGGWPLPGNNGWTTQVEEIDPRLLENGSNTVRFDLPSAIATGYQVRNLKVIGELDTGANLISSIEVPTGNGDLMLDGDETTGWSPWLKATSGSSPYMILHLARLSQIDDVKVYMKGSLSGQIKVSAEDVNGNWSNLGSGVQGGSLGQGWQDLRVKTSGMVQAVQLQFLNGSGSSGQIMELVAFGSGSGLPYGETINVTYPDQGQFYGRLAYIRGFLGTLDNGSGAAQLFIGGSPVTLNGNAFEATVSKDAVGFASSADGDPWNVVITELFPDGTKVEQKVFFNQELGAVSSNGNQAGSSTYGLNLKPGQGKAINVAGAQLIIDGTAVTSAVNLQVIPLSELDLPGMDSGMINVTGDPYRGYRFLPHGTHFAHAVTLALPYDPDLIPGGSNEQDIQTYYFDKEQGRWVPLTKASVDTTNHLVYSLTDHFTDFVNATVTVPDHPQETSFNPTQLKDIKAADPGAEINLIEPPSANNQGTANLSYPIEVPPGRHGIQPQLAVAYNSGGGNGWMGVGWDLPIQQITVETRWGAPRYSAGTYSGRETETYLLNGEMLTEDFGPGKNRSYIAHRGDSTNGNPFLSVPPSALTSSGVTFHTRVEGKFERIIRYGSDPMHYRWEVDEKDGLKMFFGAKAGASGPEATGSDPAVLATDSGNVCMWALREMKDPFGNSCLYHYNQDTAGAGRDLYLSSINYTGTGESDGPYEVDFSHGTGEFLLPTSGAVTTWARPETIVNAKCGFVRATGELLNRITVKFNGSAVRQYHFTYIVGSFDKTLLKSIEQLGPNGENFGGGATNPNVHVFNYFDSVDPTDSNGIPILAANSQNTPVPHVKSYPTGFAQQTDWTAPTVPVRPFNPVISYPDPLGGTFDGKPSLLGASQDDNFGLHLYVGVGPACGGKGLSVGAKVGGSVTDGKGRLNLIDVSGTGVPDILYQADGDNSFHYYKNLAGQGNHSFAGPFNVTGLNSEQLSKDHSDMFSVGGELYAEGVQLLLNGNFTNTKQTKYLSDANGDGLPSLVDTENNTVLFSHVVNPGSLTSESVAFESGSGNTPNPLGFAGAGIVTAGLYPDQSTQFDKLAQKDPLVDIVRQWTAPFDGVVSVGGNVTLINLPSGAPPDPHRDGVRAAVEQDGGNFGTTGSLLADASINLSQAGTPQPLSSPLNTVTVHQGDRLYFRLQSQFEGMYDQANWTPAIQYSSIQAAPATPTVNENNLDPTTYKADGDFVLAGDHNAQILFPRTGQVAVSIYLSKSVTITDDVKLVVSQQPSGGPATPLSLDSASDTIPWFQTSGPTATVFMNRLINVNKNDVLFIRVLSDTNVDLRKLNLTADVYYTAIVPQGSEPNPVPTVAIVNGHTVRTIPLIPSYDMEFYPQNDLDSPQSPLTVVEPLFTPTPAPPYPAPTPCSTNPVVPGCTTPTPIPSGYGLLYMNSSLVIAGTTPIPSALGVTVVRIPFSGTPEAVFTQTIPAGATPGTVAVTGPFTDLVNSNLPNPDQLKVVLGGVDSRMTLKNITWQPDMYYIIPAPFPGASNANVFGIPDLLPAYEAPLTASPVTVVRNLTVKPVLQFDSISNTDLGQDVYFTVKANGARVRKFTYPVVTPTPTPGFPPVFVGIGIINAAPVTLEPAVGEQLFFNFTTRDENLYETLDEVNSGITGFYGAKGFMTPFDIDDAFDAPGFANGVFSFPYRGWAYAAAKENPAGFIGNATQGQSPHLALNENDFVFPYASTSSINLSHDDITNSLNNGVPNSNAQNAIDTVGGAKALMLAPEPPNPNNLTIPSLGQWGGVKDGVDPVSGFLVDGILVQSLMMSSSRISNDNIDLPGSDLVGGGPPSSGGSSACVVGGFGASGIPKVSQTLGGSLGGGVAFASGDIDGSNTNTLSDYIDMNGDGYPSILSTNSGIQYTLPTGGLEPGFQNPVNGLNGVIRTSSNAATNVGIGGNPADLFKGGNGKNKGTGSQMEQIGFSLGAGGGATDQNIDLVPMTSSGLPDRVRYEKSTGRLFVSLNTGYGFAPEQLWAQVGDKSAVNHTDMSNFSGGVNIGFNDGIYGFGGGLSESGSKNDVHFMLANLTGDGLPDLLTSDGNGHLMVGLNTGYGFAPLTPWDGGTGEISSSKSEEFGGGGYFTVPICLLFFEIVINPGADFNTSMNAPTVVLTDMNGLGTPDEVTSDTTDGSQSDALKVYHNQTEKTNLLQSVTRPLGATITLDYTRSGNSYVNPHNRWNLTKVKVFDGGQNDNTNPTQGPKGANYQVTQYDYTLGVPGVSNTQNVYDRFERDFLGYGAVTETQMNTTQDHGGVNSTIAYRTITRQYLNFNCYEKGLMTDELTVDAGTGKKFIETTNDYKLTDVFPAPSATPIAPDASNVCLPNNTIFPKLVETDKTFFEGGPASAAVTTHQTFVYDTLGNVTTFTDFGNEDPASKVVANIQYTSGGTFDTKYLVGLAKSIVVTDTTGVTLRHREALINSGTGAVTEVDQYIDGVNFAPTSISYADNGNVTQVVSPPNAEPAPNQYTLNYTYDGTVQTYPELVTDSSNYSSTMKYDFGFGKPTTQVDENNKRIITTYDAYGRTVTVQGPFEMAGADLQHGSDFTISFDYHPEAAVPYAFTRHFDGFRDSSGHHTIDTILYTDGLKRVIQTKKSDAVRVGNSPQDLMTVSGRVVFDQVGRTIAQYYPVTFAAGDTTFDTAYDTDTSLVAPTTMQYDILDRNTLTRIPDGTSTAITYTTAPGILNNQFLTTVTDANTNHKETYRDARELITSVVEHNFKGTVDQNVVTTTYNYDPVKQITLVTDAKGNSTSVFYDLLGRRTSINNPDTGLVSMTYDLASNVTTKQTANLKAENINKNIHYHYDVNNRLKSIVYPDFPGNNVAYTYGLPGDVNNGANRIIQVADEAGTITRGYDALGDIVKETRLLKVPTGNTMPTSYTTSYVYDTWNRMQSMVYPDGEQLTYHYDSGGNADAVTGKVGTLTFPYVTSVQYDKFEQRVFVQNGNGTSSTYSYKSDNRRLKELTHNSSVDGTIADLKYTYDNVGNITDLLNNGVVASQNIGGPVTQHFDYDNLYRLIGASGDFKSFDPSAGESFESKYTLAMTYDSIHNILNKDQKVFGKHASGKDFSGDTKPTYNNNYAYDSIHPHAPKTIGGRTYTYDADGNQLGFTQTGGPDRAIVWDEENRMMALKDGGGDPLTSGVNFIYDDQGSRIMKAKGGDVTAYINQFFTVRQPHNSAGAAMSKHVFIGNTRILSQVEHGTASFTTPTSGLGGSGSTGSGSTGPAVSSSNPFVTVTTSATVYQGASQSSPPEGTANVGDVLELMPTGNSSVHNGAMVKVMFQGLIGFIPANDVTASTTTGKGGGKGGNKGGGGSTAGTSTSVLPQVQDDHFVFYYHDDHLGSTGLVTDRSGKLTENVQYFPFGETWIDQQRGMSPFPDYLFTGKTLDTETGLYYFGARYYDPRTSVWQSADPILRKYLPVAGTISYANKAWLGPAFISGGNGYKVYFDPRTYRWKDAGQKIGEDFFTDQEYSDVLQGGVYNSLNLGLYTYAADNPLIFIDPSGLNNANASTSNNSNNDDVPNYDELGVNTNGTPDEQFAEYQAFVATTNYAAWGPEINTYNEVKKDLNTPEGHLAINIAKALDPTGLSGGPVGVTKEAAKIAGEKKAEALVADAVKAGKITARVGSKLTKAIPFVGYGVTGYEIYKAIKQYENEKAGQQEDEQNK